MARLQLIKHFSLAFLGTEWKDAYINFRAFNANDISKNVVIDAKNPDAEAIQKSFQDMINLLEEKFVSGQVPTDDGKMEALKKEDMSTLEIDIVQGAITFLSQPPTQPSMTPSATS